MLFKVRALLLSLAALLLLGAVSAGAAYAAAGPFFHVREIGTEGEGEGLGQNIPLEVGGEGGKQIFIGKVGTETIEVASKSVQIKGALSNNGQQGQAKLEFIYNQPEVIKPAGKPCNVVVGENNIVVVKGHLVWKWNGTAKQLEEEKQQPEQIPELLYTTADLAAGAKELPKGTFTKLTFKGAGCGILAGTQNLGGSEIGLLSPKKVEEWSKTLNVRTLPTGSGSLLGHFWNGTGSVGFKAGLELASSPADLIGQTEFKIGQNQEVAIFEKAAPVIVVVGAAVANLGMLNLNVFGEHTFTYENQGPGAWNPRRVFKTLAETGAAEWTTPVTDNCKNNVIAAGGMCTVTLQAKNSMAGATLVERYASGWLGPWIAITANT